MALYELNGKKPLLRSADCYIAPNATVIGSVVLEHQSTIWFNAVVRGDDEEITIGERSNVQDGSVLHADPGFPLLLGKGVTIGHMVMLHGCNIGDRALIGIGAIILNGAKIGAGSLVGAGALVPEGREIPEGVLALGSPAKVIRQLSPQEILELAHIADSYVQRGRLFREELKILPAG